MFTDYYRKTPHRNALESLLRKYLPDLKGELLDVGSRNRRYDSLLASKPIAVDFVPNKEFDVQFGDVHALPFADCQFDALLCIEVFNLVSDPPRAAAELHRVLKAGGTLIFTTPFLYKDQDDLRRFSEAYLRDVLFHAFSSVVIQPIGNSYTILMDILQHQISRVRIRAFSSALWIPYLALCWFIPWVCRLNLDRRVASGYFVCAQK